MSVTMRVRYAVIPSRADDEGPPSWNFDRANHNGRKMTVMAWHDAVGVERLRDPSARFASLGMTTPFLAYGFRS
jgi:hypothetical protein